ncbi:MAG TPA: hypothetical protein VEF76_00835 [Patescibacteria group bacterium]|nr:hypothetical protein [Patescibacteria group bacterium]
MKDYAQIVYSPHLGLVERADMVANAFNQSGENAADYRAFKQAADKRVTGAMAKAIILGQSRLSQELQTLTDIIGHAGGALTPGEVTTSKKKLEDLRAQHFREAQDNERLKSDTDSLSQLFTILARAEEKMTGFDPAAVQQTREAITHMNQYHAQATTDEITSRMQERTMDGLQELLPLSEQDNASAAKKDEFAGLLKAGLTIPAPTPAPATAKFRRKP